LLIDEDQVMKKVEKMSGIYQTVMLTLVQVLIVVVGAGGTGQRGIEGFFYGKSNSPPPVTNKSTNSCKLNENSVNLGCCLSQN
jgi:hypothetical protein